MQGPACNIRLAGLHLGASVRLACRDADMTLAPADHDAGPFCITFTYVSCLLAGQVRLQHNSDNNNLAESHTWRTLHHRTQGVRREIARPRRGGLRRRQQTAEWVAAPRPHLGCSWALHLQALHLLSCLKTTAERLDGP